MNALAFSSCGAGFTRQLVGRVSSAAEIRKLSCLPGGVLASNGSDMAVFYDRVEDVVDAVLFRLMGAGDGERDDLAQQSLERIISTIVSGRFSHGCSLRSWATLITQHIAIDAMRSRTRERKLFDRSVGHQALELVAEDNRTPERAAETNRRVERLLGALSTVNRSRAEAVILHDILGHDLAEIARLTGVSVAAAQSRLVRGRKEVLRFIEGKEQ